MVGNTLRSQLMCRLCMLEHKELQSIFEYSENPLRICEMLTTIAPQLLILTDDELPKQICLPCLNKLSQAYEFQQMCINSEMQMRNKLNKITLSDYDVKTSKVDLNNKATIAENYVINCEAIEVKAEDEAQELDMSMDEQRVEAAANNLTVERSENANSNAEHNPVPISEPISNGNKKVKRAERPKMCLQCNRLFKTSYWLKRHTLVHDESRPFPCDICNYRFASAAQLVRHKLNHDDEPLGKYKCLICSNHFAKSGNLARHIWEHERTGYKGYKCTLCNRTFEKYLQLSKHARNKHPDNQNCFMQLNSRSSDHPVICKECNRVFRNCCRLEMHSTVHDSGFPFECYICKYRFIKFGQLLRHKLTHDEVPGDFKCWLCPARCAGKTSRAQHIEQHKTATVGVSFFKCFLCSRTFPSFMELNQHGRRHITNQKFKCKMCSKAYVSSESLLQHENFTHKNFCILCGKVFEQLIQMRDHNCVQVNEMPISVS